MVSVYKNKDNLPGHGNNQMNCNYNRPPDAGKVCEVNVKNNMGPCTTESKYGYDKAQPCVFIKLNKVRIITT